MTISTEHQYVNNWAELLDMLGYRCISSKSKIETTFAALEVMNRKVNYDFCTECSVYKYDELGTQEGME